MFKQLLPLILVATGVLAAVRAPGEGPTPLVTRTETQLVAVLRSDAGLKDKADACRELSVVGTSAALPALIPLLTDEKLAHMARYALETLPEPGVNAALREQLTRLKGRLLAGVIGSLAMRRDLESVDAIAKALYDADNDVVQAAARALGRLATPAAAEALTDAIGNADRANFLAFCEGLARWAESVAARGSLAEAAAIYGDYYQSAELPHQVRAAALRGAIVNRGTEGLSVLREALTGGDYILFAAAIGTALDLPGAEVTRVLTGELGRLGADEQVVVLGALARRGDPAAVPAVLAAAKAGPVTVRVAALRAAAELQTDAAVPVLLASMKDADRAVTQAARDGFAALPGPAADAAVMAMLASPDAAQQSAGIDLVGRWRLRAALPALLKLGGAGAPAVCAAALRQAGDLGTAAELPALLELLAKAGDPATLGAAEQAIASLSTRVGADTSGAELERAWRQSQPAQKGALLRVMSAVGGPGALKTVRAAVEDEHAEVRTAAIRALGEWKSAEAAPDLLALAKSASDPTARALSLRGYLDMAGNPDLSAEQRLNMCKEAAGVVQRDEEKRRLLGALGGIPNVQALNLVMPHLGNAGTRDEASAAALAIATKLLETKQAAKVAPRLVEPLTKVSEAGGNADLARRAKLLLEQAQKKAAGQ